MLAFDENECELYNENQLTDPDLHSIESRADADAEH